MDFHSLARRDLQFLCKKNRIPANLTNVAMAKALEVLETVEGIEEIQEVLVLQSPKVNLPELPHTGRKTSSRRVTRREETKIQQQQEPSPITQSNRVTVKTLNATDMTSKEEEIQETLGFKSPCIKSLEHPRTGRRNSVQRAALGEEPMIQLLKPDPLHRLRQAASTDFDITDMTYKEEEVEKKEVPHILPKTPATRKSAKGVEAQSSRRGAKKNKEVENHTETTMAVEAKGGKAIGVVTRRSTRLSSRKALEDSVTTQCKGRSSSWDHSAVKMEVLGKEDVAEKENDEDKKNIDEYGDSYDVVIVGEGKKKDQEAESHEFSSSIDYSNNGVENELEATNEDVAMLQQQQSSRATTKAVEASKIVSKKEARKKASKPLSNTHRSTWLSSRIPVEEKSREEEALKIVDLTEENAQEQEKEEEKKDHTEKRDSCVAPIEQDKEDSKEESHDYCPSSEVDNGDSIVSVVEEVGESNQEVESHGFSSSSIEGDFLNILVENGDSTAVLIEGEEMSEQELDIQVLFSSIGTENSNVNVTNVVLAEEGMIDQEESYNLSSLLGRKNSKVELYEQFESTEESSDQPPENEYVKDSSQKKRENEYVKDSSQKKTENEYVEVSSDQSPVNKVREDRSDQFSENNLVKDSSNQGSELVDGSGVLLPADEAAKDSDCQLSESKHVESGSHTSDAKLAISAVWVNLFCSELRPLLHEEAILCTQGSSEIEEEEEGKLSLLFTKMTLKDAEECGDALQDSVVAQNASFVSTKLPAAIVIPQHADLVTTADIFFPQDDCFPQDLPPALVIPPVFTENVDATTNVDNEASATKAIGEAPKGIKESGNAFTIEIPAAIEELIDDYLSDAGKLATDDSVDVQGTSFTPWSLVSSTELCTELSCSDSTMESSGDLPCELPEVIKDLFEDNLMHSCELAANGCVDVLQKTETLQGFVFELQTPVSSSELCSEFLTIDSTIKSASVDHLSAIPEESVEDNLCKLAASEPFDVPQKTEISQGGSLELQSPVSCTEQSTNVSTVDSAIEVKEASGDPPSEISAVTNESVETGILNSDELSSEKSLDAEISQDASFDPQIPVLSTAELCLGFSATTLATISSPLKLPCDTETMSPVKSSTVQAQPSEEASIAATEIAEEREETNTKALEEGVFLKDGNLELLSLTKLRAMYKQMLNGPKAEQERKKSIIKQENLQSSSGIKHDENNNQILNELETKRSVIKQEDSECLIRSSKLDSNCKQKLNDDTIMLERKRTPLKSLNYSTF